MLLCLTLAALDRYLAITRYEWYKRRVTVRGVVLLLSGSFGLTFIIVTSPFWTGFKSVYSCTINMTQMHWVFMWYLLLGLICVFLHGMIFVKSRTIIRQSQFNYSNQQPITQRFVNSKSTLRQQLGYYYWIDAFFASLFALLRFRLSDAFQ